ncbi:MAG: hypothetical protein QNJ14_17540 [Woeseiaceae bacterium]|nr:hypothetical protein [Woeseiaceae bacterium]
MIAFFIPAMAESPENAAGWYQRAIEQRQANDLDAAWSALGEAERLGFSAIRVNFEKARLHAAGGNTNSAVAALEAIAASGFTAVGIIEGDPVLATLSGNADYDKLIADMSVHAYPCAHDTAFQTFDFWVGNWDVHDGSGVMQGTNTITRDERGCVLTENWTSATGGTGMSINFLDRITGEWVQIWNSEGGSQIQIRGGMTDEGMLLVGTLHNVAAGTTFPFRGLWTPLPDGRVRQFFEQSNDGGETWVPWFEGFYTRQQ